MLSKKVILTGYFSVGKTSLFNKFLYNKFSEKYLTTIGVKVDKKVVEIENEKITLIIWDIAGEINQDKVPNAYFLGASAIIYVFDLTREETYSAIKMNLNYLKKMTPNAIVKIVGNKLDLVTEERLEEIKKELSVPYDVITSAKTGENVETLFTEVAKELL